MSSKEYIKGTIKTIVLKLLSERKRMYGYEISQKVTELSKQEIKLTYGALYPILYSLENKGFLSTSSEIVDNRARKYYSLTKLGEEEAKTKINELKRFIETLKSVLQPDPNTSLELKVCRV